MPHAEGAPQCPKNIPPFIYNLGEAEDLILDIREALEDKNDNMSPVKAVSCLNQVLVGIQAGEVEGTPAGIEELKELIHTQLKQQAEGVIKATRQQLQDGDITPEGATISMDDTLNLLVKNGIKEMPAGTTELTQEIYSQSLQVSAGPGPEATRQTPDMDGLYGNGSGLGQNL